MKKLIKRLLVISLICALVLESSNVSALTKDETVYVKLNETGSVDSVSVSEHLFDYKGNTINDKTILGNIKNVNGKEKFRQTDKNVLWDSNGNDIHYQGTYNKDLPIEVSAKYYLNGGEKNINDILGAKGKIKIVLNYKNNLYEKMNINGKQEKIYVPYAIVTTTILSNTDNKNIKVTNGKIIDNGISSVVMALSSPGLYESLGLDELKSMNKVEISFDTESFALSSIYSVATTSLFDDSKLDIFSDINDLYKSINLLQSNMDTIVSASKKLSDGSKKMDDGVTELNKKIQELTDKYKYYRNQDENTLKEELIKIVEKNINKITPDLEKEITEEASKLIKENKEELEKSIIEYTKKNTKMVVEQALSKVVNNLNINNIIEKVINSNLFNLLKNDAEVKALTKNLKDSIENEIKEIISKEFDVIKNTISNSMTDAQKQAYVANIASKYGVTLEQAAGIVNEVQADTINQIKVAINNINFKERVMTALNDKDFLANLVNTYIVKLNNKLSESIDGDHTVAEAINDVKTKIIAAIKSDLESNNLYLNTDVKTYITNLINTIIDTTAQDLASKYTEDYTNKIVKTVIEKEFSPENVDAKLRELLDIHDEDIKKKVTVLDDTVNTLSDALNKLNNGSKQLSNGMKALSDGLSKYNKEGINKLSNLVNGDVKTLQKKLDALIKLSNENRTIDNVPSGAKSNSKIIFMIDSKEKEEKTKKEDKEEKKETLGDKITGLFK